MKNTHSSLQFGRRIQQRTLRLLQDGGQPSWSQGGEDIIIGCYLPRGGRACEYLDIGAGEPKQGSNSYRFYKAGSHGILIEANPFLVHKLRKSRPKDKVIQAACGEAPRTMPFHIFDTWQLSTADPRRLKTLVDEGIRPEKTIAVEGITIALLNVTADPSSATFLSVDVEGNDLDVLRGNNWDTYCPRVVCVEDFEFDATSDSEIHTLLTERGYKLEGRALYSSIYVHEEGLVARSLGI